MCKSTSLLKLCSKYFTNVGGRNVLLLLLFDLSRSTLFIETLFCDRQGGVYFSCFTYIYHQTAIIKFQCQMRRGEYVNYITHRGVHTGQSNSVARSHILNLSMNESIFTDRDTEIYVICMSNIFFDTHRFCYLHYHKMLRYVLK